MKVSNLREEIFRRRISVIEKTILSSAARGERELPHSEAIQHWNRLLRGFVQPLSLAGFKTRLNQALSNLF